MSNMSHCRFENTERDLGDCQFALEAMLNGDETKLSHTEQKKAAKLIQTCYDILLLVQDNSGVDVEDFMNNMEGESEEIINKFLNYAQDCAVGSDD